MNTSKEVTQDSDESKISRREFIKLGGKVALAAAAAWFLPRTFLTARLPSGAELQSIEDYFSLRPSEIEETLSQGLENVVEKVHASSYVKYSRPDNPDALLTTKVFEIESFDSFRSFCSAVSSVPVNTRPLEAPPEILSQSTEGLTPADINNFKAGEGRLQELSLYNFQLTVRLPKRPTPVTFSVLANYTSPAEDLKTRGILMLFRGFGEKGLDEVEEVHSLVNKGYTVVYVDKPSGVHQENERPGPLSGIRSTFAEATKMNLLEYEDGFAALTVLRELGLIKRNTPINVIGLSFGAVQGINFALFAQNAGYKIDKVLSYAGIYDLMSRFSWSYSTLLREIFTIARADLLPDRVLRQTLMTLSPKHWLTRLTGSLGKLVLVSGTEDEVVHYSHSTSFAKVLRRGGIPAAMYLLNGFHHELPSDDQLKYVLTLKQESSDMTPKDIARLNQVLEKQREAIENIAKTRKSSTFGYHLQQFLFELGGF